MAEEVVYWLTRYSANPTMAGRNIRELAAKAPQQVVETVLPLCGAGRWGEATRLLAGLLSRCDETIAKLCDPATSLGASVCVADTLSRHEPGFDVRFARTLLTDDQMTEQVRQRGMAVLEKLSSGGRVIPVLIQFLRDPDSRIRSKAAIMFGRMMPAQRIMGRLMGDEDARVRANFLEGLWNSTTSDYRPLYRRALGDTNPRVIGNALLGLYFLGETRDVIDYVSEMARGPEALHRAAAAWVMGRTGETLFTGVLRELVQDPNPLVRRNALRSLRRINEAPKDNPNSPSR
ncbi:MAG: HEAT repeat domain-containing protein [Bryobacteraceae bacterium]